MGRTSISSGVKRRLYLTSGNNCAFPDCPEQLHDGSTNVFVGEICHIVAVHPDGPRGDTEFPSHLINEFENLVMMCPKHHVVIDKSVQNYPADVLRKIKKSHERNYEFTFSESETISGIPRQPGVDLDELFGAIETELEDPELPDKREYPQVPSYISRILTPSRNLTEAENSSAPLSEIVQTKNRITVLGVAGSGKSIELNHLAHIHSNSDSKYFPVKVRLNTITDETIYDFLCREYSKIAEIPQDRLLILLDGLDEVQADRLDETALKITKFSEDYHQATIVVSCRNNFYSTESEKASAKIAGFETYIINSLGYWDIQRYLEDQLGTDNAEHFRSGLKRNRLSDLLYSPFYLVNLMQFFVETGQIPDSKKVVFEHLINQRIRLDLDRNKNSGLNLEDSMFRTSLEIEHLAILAACMGRNYLKHDELTRLFNEKQLVRIKRTFLVDRTPDGTKWQFEHNNFQEFLSAKFLSKKKFKAIQRLVSFEPEFVKIKPTWLNTLSFLFSLLDSNSTKHEKLVNWLLKVEPDVLVRFEKDKVPTEIRQRIFKEIFEDYQRKQIIIRNEKFEVEELAEFVSDSEEVLLYLLDLLESSFDYLTVSEIVRILHIFSHSGRFKERIAGILLEKACSTEVEAKAKYECMRAMATLKINDKTTIEGVLQNNDWNSSQYLRAGFYRLIEKSDFIEDYTDLLIEGIMLTKDLSVSVNGKSTQSEPHLSDEDHSLKRVIKQIESTDCLIKILQWAKNYDSKGYGGRTYMDILKIILVKLTEQYNSGVTSVWTEVLDLLEGFSRRDRTELKEEMRKFFSDTKTSLQAFQFIGQIEWDKEPHTSWAKSYAKAVVCDDECVGYFIGQLENGDLTVSDAKQFRSAMHLDGDDEIVAQLQERLVAFNKKEFAYRPNHFDQLRKKQDKNDRILLLSKNRFRDEVLAVFRSESDDGESLTRKTLFDYKRKSFDDEKANNTIISDTIRRYAEDETPAKLSKVLKFIDDDKEWEWFQIQQLLVWDSGQHDFSFGKSEETFIRSWVKKRLPGTDFSKSIYLHENGAYHYERYDMFLAYFIERLDIPVEKEVYLNLLDVDCYLVPLKAHEPQSEKEHDESRLTDFVVRKVGIELATTYIIQNLKTKSLFKYVKKNHFKFCADHVLEQAAPFVLTELLGNSFDTYEKQFLIEYYLKMNGDVDVLYGVIDELEYKTALSLAKELVKIEYPYIKGYCTNQIDKLTDSEQQLDYIKLVLQMDEVSGLSSLKNWGEENGKIADDVILSENLTSDSLLDLLGIYEAMLKKTSEYDRGWSRSNFLERIIQIGSRNEKDYQLVKQAFNDWVSNLPNNKSLYYQIQKLEQQYYSNLSQALPYKKAVKLVFGKS